MTKYLLFNTGFRYNIHDDEIDFDNYNAYSFPYTDRQKIFNKLYLENIDIDFENYEPTLKGTNKLYNVLLLKTTNYKIILGYLIYHQLLYAPNNLLKLIKN
jgi:hypothetical protein